MPYAEKTKVPVEKSKTEIERTLARYGADRFAYFTEAGKAIIVFEAHERRLRFDLPLPADDSDKDQRARRQKWRALLLCIKAKLESVASDTESKEATAMSETGKHTEGPWWQNGNSVRTTRGIIANCPVPQHGGVFDCNANARLITAAPVMYEAILTCQCPARANTAPADIADFTVAQCVERGECGCDLGDAIKATGTP